MVHITARVLTERYNNFLYRPDDIYHVTIMPCYDKKLEASREDFYNDIYRTRDVDCVISTRELIKRFCGS